MKKIIFLIICFSLSFSVKALEKEKLENVFYKIDGKSELNQAYYLHDGDTPIYFLNPNLELGEIQKEVKALPNVDQEQLEYVTYANKIALENKGNINYYLSVQKMVVSKLFGAIIDWYDEKGDLISITTEYLDIRKKIEPNIKRTSFHQQNISTTYNETITLEDTNNVLNECEVVPNKNIVKIDGNKAYITVKEVGKKQTLFQKIIQKGKSGHFYQAENQYYIDFGTNVFITSIINTDATLRPNVSIQIASNNKHVTKSLSLEIKDEKSNTFIVQTDNNGFLKKEMEIGKYQVTILNLPSNFKNKTFDLIVDEQENINFNINLEEIRGNLFLKRQGFYLNQQGKQMVNLSDVIYDVYANSDIDNFLGETYKKGEKIVSLTLNELGEINYSLPLGSYYIVERNSYPYLLFDDEFTFTFDQDNLMISKNIVTEHVPLKVEILNCGEDDTWNLCYMVDGKLECLPNSNYYNIPFSDYIFTLKRGDKTIEYNYNFNKEGTIQLDFNKFFITKNDILEKDNEVKDNNQNTIISNNEKNQPFDFKTNKLPKTTTKSSFLFLNIILLVCLYSYVKINQKD